MTSKTPNLSTPKGRRLAWRQLIFKDHGFIRWMRKNRHWIDENMMRMAQPSPKDVEDLATMGIKTIINLRGPNENSGEYLLEQEACEHFGIKMIPFRTKSRDMPQQDVILGAKKLFEEIAYPAAMHCKSGSDRAGLIATLYAHFQLDQPIAQARSQLSLRYGHVKYGKTGMLDFFFDQFEKRQSEIEKIEFVAWVEGEYQPEKLKAEFMDSWVWNIVMDKILRRE